MVSDMGSTGLALTGKRVRLEPLEHRHVPGLVAPSVGDVTLSVESRAARRGGNRQVRPCRAGLASR